MTLAIILSSLPAIQIAECLHGQLAFGATIFPQAIAQWSTWNPELIKRMGEVIAKEATLSGVDQALSPLLDLARDPRYGRVEECFGEKNNLFEINNSKSTELTKILSNYLRETKVAMSFDKGTNKLVEYPDETI